MYFQSSGRPPMSCGVGPYSSRRGSTLHLLSLCSSQFYSPRAFFRKHRTKSKLVRVCDLARIWCVENEFYAIRRYGVLRSSTRKFQELVHLGDTLHPEEGYAFERNQK